MKRKDLRKLIIVVSLVTALAVVVPMMSGCIGKPAAAPSAAPEEGAAPAPAPAAPAQVTEPIVWRLQTYAGATLSQFVIKNSIDRFNKAANGRMRIDVYTADELVPQGELFRALQEGTVDAVQSDDDSIASPADVAIFAAYYPLSVRYGIDVNVLFEYYGLDKIWRESYDEIPGVTWLDASSWDPVNFATKGKKIEHLSDLKGLRMYMFPTGGQFTGKYYGVIPMSLPYEDVQMAVQTGELDGVAWSGITEDYTVGWADVCDYFLTNNFCGGWLGSWFVNDDSWAKVPDDLKELFMLTIRESDYFRLLWYWHGEADYRVTGTKLELTTIPDDEWQQVIKDAKEFWDETAATGPRRARVVEILKEYDAAMEKAGFPYR